jgi:hypothetical protein
VAEDVAMSDTTRAKALLAERRRRQAFPEAAEGLKATLFGTQRDFVLSPEKRKVSWSGRRGGKTYAMQTMAVLAAAQHPGAVIPIFERSSTCMAADTMWKSLIKFDATYKLGFQWHHTYKVATAPNGASIQILGADTIEQADKARGSKHPVVIVDEAQSFRDFVLRYLLEEVCVPATMDYDGSVVVSGTPGLNPTGKFWELCCRSEGWSRYHWTVLDNPTVGPKDLDDAARRQWRVDWLQRELDSNGWSWSTPKVQREYLGEWVAATDDRMYAFTRERNVIAEMPRLAAGTSWTYFLGLDLGFNDPCAFVVLARRPNDPNCYVVESYEETELVPSAVAEHVQRLRARYTFRDIIVDTGGYGKGVAMEMERTFRIPLTPALKRNKRAHVELTSGDLADARLLVVGEHNRALVDDFIALPWDDKREDAQPGYRDHLPDALLYAHGPARAAFGRGVDVAAVTSEEDDVEAVQEEKHRVARHGDDGDPDAWREKYRL